MRAKQPNFVIRAMNVFDNDEVLELGRASGIVLGDQVNLTMMKIDHNCLHIAEDVDTGKVVGVCSGFNFGSHHCTFGEYAIDPLYRKFGIGQALWSRCIDHCANRNAAILATPKNVNKYREKSGFRVIPARKLLQFGGYPQLFMLNKYHESCDFEWINALNLADVMAFDEQVCGINRGTFLQFSSAEPSTVGMLARDLSSGKVTGYGLFRRANHSGAIVAQPLYATTVDIAEVLLYSGLQKFAAFDRLILECWDINPEAVGLARDKLGLEQVKSSTVMFTEYDIGANFRYIFSNSPSVFYPF